MESLKNFINNFYDNHSEGFTKRVIKCQESKKESFKWMFGDNLKIKIDIPDNLAIDYFYDNNYDFREVYRALSEFDKENDYCFGDVNLLDAVYKNKITYQNNTWKVSKFFKKILGKDLDFQQFYDKLKGADCYISIDARDFLSSSENSSFTSCYSKDGCHHLGNISYLRDDVTLIAYTCIGNKKIGRQFIYVIDGYLIFGKVYGSINDAILKEIREKMQSLYSKHLSVKNNWIISSNEIDEDQVENAGHYHNEHSDFSVYFDLDINRKCRHKFNTDDFNNLHLEFHDGFDLQGYDTQEGESGSIRCTICGEHVNEDYTYNYNGESYCEECFHEHYFYCDQCGDAEPLDNLVTVNGCDEYLCEYCAQKNYYQCDVTGEYYDEIYTMFDENGNEINVNEEYYYDNSFMCDECGDCHHTDNLHQSPDGDNYCEDCFNSKFVKCDECDEIIAIDDSIEIDGKYYCSDCKGE